MDKIRFHENKILKLTNVLKYELLFSDEKFDFNVAIRQMQSYIQAKGAMPVGPLIQYTKTYMNENEQLDMKIVMMLQCNHFIHNVEAPYSMDSIIRVPNALYCRYYGPENMLKFAYDKINLEAFEKDIDLETSNYTIFVERNVEEEILLADVFVPRAESV